MYLNFYLRKGRVYFPTVARTDAGYYLDIEPVSVASVSDIQGISTALRTAIERGNPAIEAPSRDNFPSPVLLSHANVKSWATFERLAKAWAITKSGASFRLYPRNKLAARGWQDDAERVRIFEGDGAIDALVDAAVQQILHSAPGLE